MFTLQDCVFSYARWCPSARRQLCVPCTRTLEQSRSPRGTSRRPWRQSNRRLTKLPSSSLKTTASLGEQKERCSDCVLHAFSTCTEHAIYCLFPAYTSCWNLIRVLCASGLIGQLWSWDGFTRVRAYAGPWVQVGRFFKVMLRRVLGVGRVFKVITATLTTETLKSCQHWTTGPGACKRWRRRPLCCWRAENRSFCVLLARRWRSFRTCSASQPKRNTAEYALRRRYIS